MSIRDRLKESEDGILTLKVSPEEWLLLAAKSQEVELFYTNKDENDPAFNLNGIVIYCEDASRLRALQKVRAVHFLESLLWRRESD